MSHSQNPLRHFPCIEQFEQEPLSQLSPPHPFKQLHVPFMHLPLPEHWLGQPVEEKRAIQENCNNFNTIYNIRSSSALVSKGGTNYQ